MLDLDGDKTFETGIILDNEPAISPGQTPRADAIFTPYDPWSHPSATLTTSIHTELARTGNALANTVIGTAANNVLDGKGGADIMLGGQGNDTYVVDNVHDQVVEEAGQGRDAVKASVSYALADDVETLTLTGSSNAAARGNDGANALIGNSGANKLIGGAGHDTLTGGAGADTFVFKTTSDSTVASNGCDTIQDFHHSQHDRIDLHLIDASSKSAGNQAFHFIGSDHFGHHAGELQEKSVGGNTLVSGDVTGDGRADFAIVLHGHVALHAGDFVL